MLSDQSDSEQRRARAKVRARGAAVGEPSKPTQALSATRGAARRDVSPRGRQGRAGEGLTEHMGHPGRDLENPNTGGSFSHRPVR